MLSVLATLAALAALAALAVLPVLAALAALNMLAAVAAIIDQPLGLLGTKRALGIFSTSIDTDMGRNRFRNRDTARTLVSHTPILIAYIQLLCTKCCAGAGESK